MSNKKWLALFSVVALLGVLDWRMRPSKEALSVEAYDPFVQKAVIEKQQYMETDFARGLISLNPTAPGHCLIIPKRAVARFEDLTSTELTEMGYIIRRTQEAMKAKLGACDYVLLQKNGACVGQASNHLIWHYIPRSVNEKSVLLFTMRFAHPFHAKLSDEEMKEWASSMGHLIEEKDSKEIIIEVSEPSKDLDQKLETDNDVAGDSFEVLIIESDSFMPS